MMSQLLHANVSEPSIDQLKLSWLKIIFFHIGCFSDKCLFSQGDIFKIQLENDDDMVTEIKLKYFDTVPVATAMNVLKTGFLFVASEFGNQ